MVITEEKRMVVILLSPEQTRKKLKELPDDPMGSVMATYCLLDPENQGIVKEIRNKYELENIPLEIEERMRHIHKRCRENARNQISIEKIFKEVYRRVSETAELKDVPDQLVKIDELLKVLKIEGLKKKRGKPKKEEWLPWPQADIANTVYWWAVLRILLPLPEYFYNPSVNLEIDGAPAMLAIFSPLNENMIGLKERRGKGSDKKSKSKKRNLDTLERDAYYYLLKNEDKQKSYTDIATYIIEEGMYENNQFDSEDEEFEARKKLSSKINRACNRLEQFAYSLVGQNN